MTGAPGSLQSVLDAMAQGARSVDELGAATGLDTDLVRLALDRLVALGRIERDRSALACPPAHCTGCAAPTGSGCSTGGLVTLTLRAPRPAVSDARADAAAG